MALIPEPNQEKPTRAALEKAFAVAEASLRLEGMVPTDVYFSVKERVLAREITLDQAAEEINAHYTQIPERGSMTPNVGLPESDPSFSPATGEAPTSETVKNPEEEAAREGGRRFLELAGTMPEIEDVRRLLIDDFLDAVEKISNTGHHRMACESVQIATEEADYPDDLRRADPVSYYRRMETIDPVLRELEQTDHQAYYKRLARLENIITGKWIEVREFLTPYIEERVRQSVKGVDEAMEQLGDEVAPILRKLADSDPEAFLRHLEASHGLAAAGGTEPDLEDTPRQHL